MANPTISTPQSVNARAGAPVNAEHAGGAELQNGNIMSFVQAVMREAYMQNVKDLRAFGQKVKFYNNVRREIRQNLKDARTAMANEKYPFTPPKAVDTTFKGSSVPGQGPSEAKSSQPSLPSNQEVLAMYQSGDKSISDLVSMCEQGKIAKGSLDFVRQHLDNQWRSGPKETTSKKHSTISGDGNKHGNKVKDKKLADVMLSNGGNAWIDSVVAWYNDLPPEQQQAFVEKWKTEGMRFKAKAKDDGDGWFNSKDKGKYDDVRKLPAGKDPADWLRSECERAIKQAGDELGSEDMGKKVKLNKFEFSVHPGSVDVPTLPDKPADLKAVEGALGVSSGAGSAQSGEWTPGSPCENEEQLKAYIKQLEDKLNSVGEDAQLANVDLQNSMQRMQQTLSRLANISKNMHDTAMNTIRKIG